METLFVTIPGHIEPLERGERFEFPLCDLFDEIGGDLVGSGCRLAGGEILESDIQLTVTDLTIALPRIIQILKRGSAPAGTEILHVDCDGMKKVFRLELVEEPN